MLRRESAQLHLRRASRERLWLALLTLLAILAIAVLTCTSIRPARAAQYDCDSDGGCVSQRVPDSLNVFGPKIIHVPSREIDQAREGRWTARCEPKIVEDNYGVERYTYKPGVIGCEFGKDR